MDKDNALAILEDSKSVIRLFAEFDNAPNNQKHSKDKSIDKAVVIEDTRLAWKQAVQNEKEYQDMLKKGANDDTITNRYLLTKNTLNNMAEHSLYWRSDKPGHLTFTEENQKIVYETLRREIPDKRFSIVDRKGRPFGSLKKLDD